MTQTMTQTPLVHECMRSSRLSCWEIWWTWSGSNRRPLPCHGSALPAAPQAHAFNSRLAWARRQTRLGLANSNRIWLAKQLGYHRSAMLNSRNILVRLFPFLIALLAAAAGGQDSAGAASATQSPVAYASVSELNGILT